jgi:hypothetical protein
MKQGEAKVDQWLATGNKNINGWNVGSFFGDEAFYNGDWVMRAGAAKGGLLGNDAVEAMYPYTVTDATGEPLDGSKHNYTNHLRTRPTAAGERLLVSHDLRRRASSWSRTRSIATFINSPMVPGMKTEADGSLTLYIQKDSPGSDKEANWLPAPDSTIYLVMRLYWPDPEPPSILPPGEGAWQPPGVKQVSS